MEESIKLKFKETELEFSFGLYFLGEFLEEQKLDLSEIDERLQKNPFKFIPTLMYGSYKFNPDLDSEPITYKAFVKLLSSVGGVGSEVVQKFIQGFTSCLIGNLPQEESDEAKKK